MNEPGYNIVLKILDKKFWVKFRISQAQFGWGSSKQLMTTCTVRPIGTLDIFSAASICNPKDTENVYDGCRWSLKKVAEQRDFLKLFENEVKSPCHIWSDESGFSYDRDATMIILPNPGAVWEECRQQLWNKLGSKLHNPFNEE